MKMLAKTKNYILLCLSLVMLYLPVATLDASPVTSGASNVAPPKPSNIGGNNYSLQAGIVQEVHTVEAASANSIPAIHCTNNGSYIYGSMQQVPGSVSGTWATYTYACSVPYTYGDKANANSNYSKEQTGWITAASTTLAGITQTDSATMQWPTGWPITTFITYSNFYFDGSGSDYGYQWVEATLNGVGANSGSRSSSDTIWNSASIQTTVQPGGYYTFWKHVSANWNDTCTGTVYIPPAWIGKFVFVDCCPLSGVYTSAGDSVNFKMGEAKVKGQLNASGWAPGCP